MSPGQTAIAALLSGDEQTARVLVAAMQPGDRGRLADAAHRLHDLCTQAAVAGAAPAFAQPAGSSRLFGGHSRPFTAQYDGRCSECGDEITSDVDEIVMTDGGAVHVDCAS